MGRTYFVYIVTNRKNGAVYVGVTNDLVRRTYEHRNGLIEGFSKDHNCKRLVWYEVHEDITEAITREKRIKDWHRDWKLRMISEANPNWRDLWWEITGQKA